MVAFATKYRRSSYNTYLGNRARYEFVDVEPVLACFSRNDGHNEYRKFVLQAIEEEHRAEYYEAAEEEFSVTGNSWRR